MKNNWIIGLVLAIILAVIAVIFALQNAEPTAVSFLSWDLELPLALIILSTFAIGAITTLLLTIPGTYKRRRHLSTLKKEKLRLTDQLDKAISTATSNIDESVTESRNTFNDE